MIRKLISFLMVMNITSCVLAQDVVELDKVKNFDIEYKELMSNKKQI